MNDLPRHVLSGKKRVVELPHRATWAGTSRFRPVCAPRSAALLG